MGFNAMDIESRAAGKDSNQQGLIPCFLAILLTFFRLSLFIYNIDTVLLRNSELRLITFVYVSCFMLYWWQN